MVLVNDWLLFLHDVPHSEETTVALDAAAGEMVAQPSAARPEFSYGH